MGRVEVAFRKVPRIKIRSGRQQYFPFEMGKGVRSIVGYSSTFQNDE